MSFSGYESGPEGAVRIDRARYQRITFFFARVIAHLVWWDIVLRQVMPGRVLASRSERWRLLARRFRQLAVEMGGVLIKLGQFLSTRVDVLPSEIIDELRGLQDEVPPVETEAILTVIEDELGGLAERFREIETEPMAAASLGQVHRAWLQADEAQGDGAVVIKVQRPGIVQLVQTDLAALRVVARWIMYYPPIRRRADVPALMEEFARTLWEELDYEQEADNVERFAQMFAGDEGVYIPAVYRRHSTGRVLVLENVEAIKITDVAGMEAAGIDSKEVAARLLDVYLKQVFEEGFFHADPHPGNLFVQPCAQPVQEVDEEEEAPSRPFRLIFVDFGMVGRIETLRSESLRKVLFSATQRDAQGLTEAYQELGFFLPGVDLERIAEAQEVMLDRLWGRNLMEMTRPDPQEVQELAKEFRDILFEFPFQVPQNFIYLGRAIGMLSGLASTLDPQFDPWYQVETYGMTLLRRRETQQLGVESVVETVKLLVQLPLQLQRVLTAAERGRLRVEAAPDRQMVRQMDRLERKITQLQMTIVGATGVLSAVLFYLFRRRDG